MTAEQQADKKPTAGRCHPGIAWLHIPKTGSSFMSTLLYHANSSLPDDALSATQQGVPEDPGDYFSAVAKKYPVLTWFRGVFWAPGGEGNAQEIPAEKHDAMSDEDQQLWHGKFVTLFRNPEERIFSQYYHFAKGLGSVAEYARRVSGRQTKMVTGQLHGLSCAGGEAAVEIGSPERCDQVRRELPDVNTALARLQDGTFAFVGLTEEYDLSVCLFHAMFGGECHPAEFRNLRPGRGKRNLTLLEGVRDPYDGELFAAAQKLFRERLRLYGVSRSSCAARICPRLKDTVFAVRKEGNAPAQKKESDDDVKKDMMMIHAQDNGVRGVEEKFHSSAISDGSHKLAAEWPHDQLRLISADDSPQHAAPSGTGEVSGLLIEKAGAVAGGDDDRFEYDWPGRYVLEE